MNIFIREKAIKEKYYDRQKNPLKYPNDISAD